MGKVEVGDGLTGRGGGGNPEFSGYHFPPNGEFCRHQRGAQHQVARNGHCGLVVMGIDANGDAHNPEDNGPKGQSQSEHAHALPRGVTDTLPVPFLGVFHLQKPHLGSRENHGRDQEERVLSGHGGRHECADTGAPPVERGHEVLDEVFHCQILPFFSTPAGVLVVSINPTSWLFFITSFSF